MSDTPTDDMIPTPARVVKFWDEMSRHTTHNAHCWMNHPACALRRVYGELSSDIERRQHEIERLRQGLWDIFAALGGDTDGDPTPAALVGDIVELVMVEARELRAAYDEPPYD